MLKSVTLLGSSSGRNAGDAALMSSIMDAVDQACGTRLLYEIPTINTGFIRRTYTNRTRPVGLMPWNLSLKIFGLPTYLSVMRTDLTLIFDAILFDRSLYNPLFNFLSTLYLFLPMAKKRGKRLGFYNVGAGPVGTPTGRRMLKSLADTMDFITVRDESSFRILKDIGVTNPRMMITADAALNTEAAPVDKADALLGNLGLDPKEEFLALNVNTYLATWSGTSRKALDRETFLAVYSAAVNRLIETLRVPILVVATQHMDVELSEALMARLKSAKPVALITNRDHSHYELKAVLGRASLLFAMRLHSIILASSALTPVAGLAYQPKLNHYFALLGIPEHCMTFDDFSEESLVRHLTRAWEKRSALRDMLVKKMPDLQKNARIAAELTACIHRGEDLDSAFTRYSVGAISRKNAESAK